MIETALIDGDIVAYRCAAANEGQSETLACWQTSEYMRRILHETNAMGFKCFLSGGSNFRYGIYPDYKANRADKPKPTHLQLVRSHLVTDWAAQVADGIEADDHLGIEQCLGDGDTIICSIDKDLLQIPGQHYNFVTTEFRHVSPLDGIKQLYFQLIMGDRSDNIPGYDGKMRTKVPKFLENHVDFLFMCTDEKDMYSYVLDLYCGDKDIMHRNAKCLYIWHKENDEWIPPFEREECLDRSSDQELHHKCIESGLPSLAP